MADDGGYRVRTPGSAGSGSEQTAEQED